MAFEAILSQHDAKPKRWRRVMLTVSLGLHAGALSAGVLHSIWQVEEMPMPSLQVTLTAAPPPPPPPPPPAGRKSADTKPKSRDVKPQELVVPKDTKNEPKPEPDSNADSGQKGGEAVGQTGGVEGGVAGGVVGGVVGAAPAPPPLKPAGPKLVSAKIARGQLLIDPNAEPYRVKLPPPLARSGETYVAMLRVCVSAEGAVTGVQLMKGASPAIDAQFPRVLGRWRYRPLLADGQPTPFCYQLRYEVTGR